MQRAYSPAPYRTASMTYGDPRLPQLAGVPDVAPVRYQEPAPQDNVRYVDRSPPRIQEYHDPYARAQSPALMPPPAAPPRTIVVDQFGRQYYTAESAPTPTRASVAPVDRRPHVEPGYERAPSRMASSYGQPVPAAVQYEQPEVRMGPPPLPRRGAAPEQPVQYVDANGYRIEYSARPVEQVRYAESPTSPTYQVTSRYDQMPPPQLPPAREPTSPVYTPTRSYSVRPEEPAHQTMYAPRQASVAPQFFRQEAAPPPPRAMSVAPGYEQPAASYPRAYSQVPQQVMYVDQYGRPIPAGELRQMPAPEYRYG